MKIAMIGHKQFPSRSGGVEVVVYELATRLAKKDYDVTVYNRGKVKGKNKYKEEGVNVIRSATFEKSSLNAMAYSFMATFNALFKKYDIVHYHAIGPSVPLLLAHIFGKKRFQLYTDSTGRLINGAVLHLNICSLVKKSLQNTQTR